MPKRRRSRLRSHTNESNGVTNAVASTVGGTFKLAGAYACSVQPSMRSGMTPPAAPAPPVARALAARRELGCADRPALSHFGISLRHVHAARRAHETLRPFAVLVHAVAKQRIERGWQQARGVAPVLEKLALFI